MKAKRSPRDVGIELARLLACLIVIGVHVSLNDYETGTYDISRGYINCLVADGVAIFWMITGCFLFRSSDYGKVLRRTGKTVVLPLALFSVFSWFFTPWLVFGTPLRESIARTPQEYEQGLRQLLAWRNPVGSDGHLWYCYVYLLVILCFPILRAFARWMEEAPRREWTFLAVSFGLFALNDITANSTFAFSHFSLNGAVPAAVEMLWGHILYRHKDTLLSKGRLWLFGAPVVFFGLNYLRMRQVLHSGTKAILYWYTTVGIVCAVCVIGFCLALCRKVRGDSLVARLIAGLGGCTFVIYLTHFTVRNVVYRYGWHTRLFGLLDSGLDGIVQEAVYTLCLLLAVFAISLAVTLLLRGLKALVTLPLRAKEKKV